MMIYLAYAFTGLIFAAMALSVLYTATRLRSVFGMSRRWPMAVGLGIILAGSLAMAAIAVRSQREMVGYGYVASGLALYLFLNMFLALSCAHLVERVTKAGPRRYGIVALLVALAATVVGAVNANSFAVVETTIPLRGLRKDLTVMEISDLHLGHHRGADYLTKIVEETNRRRPDLVVITGDLLDSAVALRPGMLDPLSRFSAPVYYVHGNHEDEVGTAAALRKIADQGVHVLRNRVVRVDGIQLVGLDYMNADKNAFNMHPSHKRDTIRSVLSALKVDPDMPSVLLHHSPTGLAYAEAKGIDLVLAGHTHGGQVFPFNLVVPLLFPYSQGLHEFGRTTVFVSTGAGTFLIRARLGVPNKIDLIRLKAETSR